MKRYLTYDACNGGFERHDTIAEAREYLKECFFCETYHPDTAYCQIFELKEVVKVEVTDEKLNYKYENEDDVPVGADDEAWPYGSDVDEIWDVSFVDVKEGEK